MTFHEERVINGINAYKLKLNLKMVNFANLLKLIKVWVAFKTLLKWQVKKQK